jgi:hypothetical protein
MSVKIGIQTEVQGGLLLDVIVRKGSAVFELLPSENETLLVWRDAVYYNERHFRRQEETDAHRSPFLILYFGLDIVDGVRGLDLERDGLPGESLHEDLHATTET